jgi:hypothetical protein
MSGSREGPAGGVETPVRVYVGSQEAQMLPVKVLEYSIRKHSSLPAEIFPLHHEKVEMPLPRDVKNRPRTPFSFQRFQIPKLAGFHGRAIYLDSDMQVFKDLRELWEMPFDGADLLAAWEPGESGRRPQFSVMILNCEILRWDLHDIVRRLDRGELTYETLMYEMKVVRHVRASIDPSWNSLERFETGRTALLHYTDMTRQPWISRENPLGYLWMGDLFEALDRGFVDRAMVEAHVQSGHLRPSILYQVDHRLEDSRSLPADAVMLDDGFVPPYERMDGHATSRGSGLLQLLRALVRRIYRRGQDTRKPHRRHEAGHSSG